MRNIDTIALIFDKIVYCRNLFRDIDMELSCCEECTKAGINEYAHTSEGYRKMVEIINTLNEVSFIIRSLTEEMHSMIRKELDDELVLISDLETDEKDMAVSYLITGFKDTEGAMNKVASWCAKQLHYFRAMEQISHVSSVKRLRIERKLFEVDNNLVVFPYV